MAADWSQQQQHQHLPSPIRHQQLGGPVFFSTAWRTSSGAKWPWLPESHSLAAANIRFLTVVLLLRCLVLVHLLAEKWSCAWLRLVNTGLPIKMLKILYYGGEAVSFTDWWSLANLFYEFCTRIALALHYYARSPCRRWPMMFVRARKSPRSSSWVETTTIHAYTLQIIWDWCNRQYFEYWHNECNEHLFDVTYDTRVMECPNFGSKVCTSSKLNIKNTAKSMQLLLRGSVSLPIRSDVALLKKLQSSSRRMQGSRLSL